MKVIGLTGGIGSGKSTVAEVFKSFGVPVFNSDLEAKKLYQNKEVLSRVKEHFGEAVFENGALSFAKLAEVVFNDDKQLTWINQLIHPLVQQVFEVWKSKQHGDFVIKESAILFESGANEHCDQVITVEASKNLRIKRVMKRDGVTQKQVEERISKQITDNQRKAAANFVIKNDGEELNPQVAELLKLL